MKKLYRYGMVLIFVQKIVHVLVVPVKKYLEHIQIALGHFLHDHFI